jgi:hypothetical protein
VKRYAVSSYIPDPAARYWCFHWPASGPAVRAEVVRGMPKPDYCKVLSLPCEQPGHLHWQDHGRWVVLEIDERDFVDEEGLVRFSQGNVIFNGTPQDACKFIRDHGLPVPSSLKEVKVGGDWDNVSTGEHGISIAGWHSRAESGRYGLAYANQGTAIVGEYGVATAVFGEAVAGDKGVSVATYGAARASGFGIAIACNEFQNARAGDRGLAVAAFGHSGGGNATAGKGGMALTQGGGSSSTVHADEGGVLAVLWDDGRRWRLAVAYVGENGIRPNVSYSLSEDGSFIPAKKE